MKTFITNHLRAAQMTGAALAVATIGFVTAAVAGATTYDPTSALTGLGSSAASTASPILIAVVVALIPLGIVLVVTGWVRGWFHLRGKIR